MSLQTLLSVSRGTLFKNGFYVKRRPGDMATINHVLAAPPRVRISFTEKVVLGVILSIGVWFIPAWVMYNMPEYQKVERNKYLGQ